MQPSKRINRTHTQGFSSNGDQPPHTNHQYHSQQPKILNRSTRRVHKYIEMLLEIEGGGKYRTRVVFVIRF